MTDAKEIQIDRNKAERIIAQTLRAVHGLKPADANEAATVICNRLLCSMPIHGGSPMSNGGTGPLWSAFR